VLCDVARHCSVSRQTSALVTRTKILCSQLTSSASHLYFLLIDYTIFCLCRESRCVCLETVQYLATSHNIVVSSTSMHLLHTKSEGTVKEHKNIEIILMLHYNIKIVSMFLCSLTVPSDFVCM